MSCVAGYTLVMVIGTFVFLGLMFFVGCTKHDALESYFSENAEVRKRRQRGRFHSMGLIINILHAPKSSVKEGLVTEAELASVPLSLKRWAVWPYRLALIWAISWGYWCTWL